VCVRVMCVCGVCVCGACVVCACVRGVCGILSTDYSVCSRMHNKIKFDTISC